MDALAQQRNVEEVIRQERVLDDMQLKSKQELLRTAWDDQIAKNKVMREIMNSDEKLKNN